MFIKAKKSLGQNFLIDLTILDQIATALMIQDHNILEIGPGYGALTEYLIAQSPRHLDLVELDPDMIEILSTRQREEWSQATLSIHHQDILSYVPTYPLGEPYSVIANIPYYITSPILARLLYDLDSSPREMVIMMQQEVGEKILAGHSRKLRNSPLSLSIELRCESVEMVTLVPRSAFSPAPRVDSIVLRFSVRGDRDRELESRLSQLWRIAFAHPRQTLSKNLRSTPYSPELLERFLDSLGYSRLIRAEALSLGDWIEIDQILSR